MARIGTAMQDALIDYAIGESTFPHQSDDVQCLLKFWNKYRWKEQLTHNNTNVENGLDDWSKVDAWEEINVKNSEGRFWWYYIFENIAGLGESSVNRGRSIRVSAATFHDWKWEMNKLNAYYNPIDNCDMESHREWQKSTFVCKWYTECVITFINSNVL